MILGSDFRAKLFSIFALILEKATKSTYHQSIKIRLRNTNFQHIYRRIFLRFRCKSDRCRQAFSDEHQKQVSVPPKPGPCKNILFFIFFIFSIFIICTSDFRVPTQKLATARRSDPLLGSTAQHIVQVHARPAREVGARHPPPVGPRPAPLVARRRCERLAATSVGTAIMLPSQKINFLLFLFPLFVFFFFKNKL